MVPSMVKPPQPTGSRLSKCAEPQCGWSGFGPRFSGRALTSALSGQVEGLQSGMVLGVCDPCYASGGAVVPVVVTAQRQVQGIPVPQLRLFSVNNGRFWYGRVQLQSLLTAHLLGITAANLMRAQTPLLILTSSRRRVAAQPCREGGLRLTRASSDRTRTRWRTGRSSSSSHRSSCSSSSSARRPRTAARPGKGPRRSPCRS